MDLIVETDPGLKPLPPPQKAREKLKRLALEKVKEWVDKFGEGYKKLALGYNYLRQVPSVLLNIFF